MRSGDAEPPAGLDAETGHAGESVETGEDEGEVIYT